MTKTTKSIVRLLGRDTADNSAATIATPYGVILSGTPEADHYLAMQAYFEPLSALHRALVDGEYAKADAITEIEKVLPLIPESQARIAALLESLAAALRSGAPRAHLMQDLGGHVDRVAFGRACAAASAPKPIPKDAPQLVKGQPLGSGAYQRWMND